MAKTRRSGQEALSGPAEGQCDWIKGEGQIEKYTPRRMFNFSN